MIEKLNGIPTDDIAQLKLQWAQESMPVAIDKHGGGGHGWHMTTVLCILIPVQHMGMGQANS